MSYLQGAGEDPRRIARRGVYTWSRGHDQPRPYNSICGTLRAVYDMRLPSKFWDQYIYIYWKLSENPVESWTEAAPQTS